jgi:DNA mismatch repair protein MutS
LEFIQYPLATQSLCFLLDFISDHNTNAIKRMVFPVFHNSDERLIMANHTLKQLNIIEDENAIGSGKLSSVLSFLNQCVTAMGKRRFKEQLLHPTSNISWLNREYSMIQEFIGDQNIPLRKIMTPICDFEKIMRQWVLRRFSPSSIVSLYESLERVEQIHCCLYENKNVIDYLIDGYNVTNNDMSILVKEIMTFIRKHINLSAIHEENGCLQINMYPELGKITEEYQTALNKLNGLSDILNQHMQQQQDAKQQNTSKKQSDSTTSYIRIHKTEKSGFSLQITRVRAQVLKELFKSRLPTIQWMGESVPTSSFSFHSTTDSMETIDCTWIRNINHSISSLYDSLKEKFQYYYGVFLNELESEWFSAMELFSDYISKLDVLLCRAHVAMENNYCCPTIIKNNKQTSSCVEAKTMRHILIEQLLKNELYVPNDISLEANGILLFGVNSSGKTSLLRSLGICIILAQSGNFVPCSEFTYFPYHSIFSRIVGCDNLFRGLSSFGIEMSELKVILKMADSNSLVLADEVSRGSEMDSAISITTSTIEYLAHSKASFFITSHLHDIVHFDEIVSLQTAKKLNINHLQVDYDASLDTLVYNRKLQVGSGESFYGLLVCRSLHLPQDFIDRAYAIREKYMNNGKSILSASVSHFNSQKIRGLCEICGKKSEEIHHLIPQKMSDDKGAINGLFHKNHVANLASVCKTCHDNIHHNEKDEILERKKTLKGYKLIKPKTKI